MERVYGVCAGIARARAAATARRRRDLPASDRYLLPNQPAETFAPLAGLIPSTDDSKTTPLVTNADNERHGLCHFTDITRQLARDTRVTAR